LKGPFSFKGHTEWNGKEREVRVVTGGLDYDGGYRFKASVRDSTKRGSTYSVDGRFTDLKGTPRLEGEVTAKLQLDPAQMPKAQAEAAPVQKAEAPLVDFKANIAGDAKGLELDDISISFESVGQPQLVTGAAQATWENALSIDLNLASRWLDLDKIAVSSPSLSPFDTARSFISALMQALPTDAESKLRFDLDQANLGGEAVSGIRLEIARSKGMLLVKDLRASLPGGARLALDGTVADVEKARGFQGELALRGTSLTRFLNWASKDTSVAEAVRSEGPFFVQGRLGLGKSSIDLTDVGAEIGGTPLTGEVHYSTGERTRLAIVLEGHEIDATQLWPAGVDYLKGMLVASAPEDAAKAETEDAGGTRWLGSSNTDVTLSLKAGKLLTGGQRLRDVGMDVTIDQGRLLMPTLNFVTDDGLAFELEGNVADVSGKPHGVLRWVLTAPAPSAALAFIRLVDLPEENKDAAMRLADLAPLRLAGTIKLGERNDGAADIFVDGTVQGGRVVATAHLDGGLRHWRQQGADFSASIESPHASRLLASLSGRKINAPSQARAGEIFVKAVGTPVDGMRAMATVRAPGLALAYEGQLALPAEGSTKFDGEVHLSSRDLGSVLALAGLGDGRGLRNTTIVGKLAVVSSEHAIEFKPRKLAIGGSKVGGSIALAYPDNGPTIVTSELDVDRASIPGLLAAVVDRGTEATVKTEPVELVGGELATGGKSIWPELPFDFSAFNGIEGKFAISFGTLTLEQGMAIKKARLEVTVVPGKVEVTKLEGSALGGKVLATLAVERAAGGASIAGDLKLTGAHLVGAASGAAKKTKDATASLSLAFSGRASSPRALMTVATGNGDIALADVRMRAPTPLAVVATAEAVLNGEAGGSGEELNKALHAQLASSDVKVGPRTIAIDIADGAAKFSPVTLQSEAGRTTVKITVDLASLVVDSSWQVEPGEPDVVRPDLPRKGALPSISVVYVGPLKDAWSLKPRITSGQLERELAIRRMELDAEQLERLHRRDAERARQEQARREVLEAERAARAASEAAAEAVPEPEPASPPTWTIVPPEPSLVSPRYDNAPLGTGAADPRLNIPPIDAQDVQTAAPVSGETPPETAGETVEPPRPTYRRRRAVRRSLPPGEQIMRSLRRAN
ncbi:MAG: AsmA-like C-terminal region-containing protein, partial [Hyphomicrobium sp.]